MKRKHTEDLWTEQMAFYLDEISFVHNVNRAVQARAPKGRNWQIDNEGLAFSYTQKARYAVQREE